MTSARALGDLDDLSVVTHEAEYEEGLAAFRAIITGLA